MKNTKASKIKILFLFFISLFISCFYTQSSDLDRDYSLEVQFNDRNNIPVDASGTLIEMKYSSIPCRNNSTSFKLLVGEDTLLPSYSVMYGNYYLNGFNHLQIRFNRRFSSSEAYFEYINEKFLQSSLKIILLNPQDLEVIESYSIKRIKYVVNGQLISERRHNE